MEKFPENQNNNSESNNDPEAVVADTAENTETEAVEQKAEKKGGFKNKLKVWLGLGATAVAVTAGAATIGKNAKEAPKTDLNEPKTEADIDTSNVTTSQDIDTIDLGDGTSVDISGDTTEENSEVEEKSGEVNPDDFWEGGTFHLDDYATALGYEVRGEDEIIIRYDGGDHLAIRFHPGSLKLTIDESFETKVSLSYHFSDGDSTKTISVNSDIQAECCDSLVVSDAKIINNYIKTLQLYSSVNNPYEHINDLDCWK